MAINLYNGRLSINNSLSNITNIIPPVAILLGYVPATTPTFINDCTVTFSSLTCTVPIYVKSTGDLGNPTQYSLGQLADSAAYTVTGVPFYINTSLTTTLPSPFGPVYGFSATFGGNPNRQIRINSTPDYDGFQICTTASNGYYVFSSTKVNVGSANQLYTATDYTGIPYYGCYCYQNVGGTFFSTGTTIAWAASPNVTATHLFTFNGSWVSVIA